MDKSQLPEAVPGAFKFLNQIRHWYLNLPVSEDDCRRFEMNVQLLCNTYKEDEDLNGN